MNTTVEGRTFEEWSEDVGLVPGSAEARARWRELLREEYQPFDPFADVLEDDYSETSWP